jgi:hypothetical protein
LSSIVTRLVLDLALSYTKGDDTVAFFSQAVAPHHAKLPAYEQELIELVKAVRYWQPYLWVALSPSAPTIGV